MKTMIFGAALLLSGVVGFVGWAVACACVHRTTSVLSGMFYSNHFAVTVVFMLLAVAGLIVCIQEWKAP